MKRKIWWLTLVLPFFLASCDRGPGENREVEAIIKKRCSLCHTTERIYKAKFSREEWEKTVDRMIRHGAELTSEEREKIVEFLSGRQ
ncbi:hypothetical protein [Thermosulfuriphilus sp.]